MGAFDELKKEVDTLAKRWDGPLERAKAKSAACTESLRSSLAMIERQQKQLAQLGQQIGEGPKHIAGMETNLKMLEGHLASQEAMLERWKKQVTEFEAACANLEKFIAAALPTFQGPGF